VCDCGGWGEGGRRGGKKGEWVGGLEEGRGGGKKGRRVSECLPTDSSDKLGEANPYFPLLLVVTPSRAPLLHLTLTLVCSPMGRAPNSGVAMVSAKDVQTEPHSGLVNSVSRW